MIKQHLPLRFTGDKHKVPGVELEMVTATHCTQAHIIRNLKGRRGHSQQIRFNWSSFWNPESNGDMLWINGTYKLIYEFTYETGNVTLTWPISPATMWATSTGSSPQRTQSPPSRTETFDLLVSDMTLEPSVDGILYFEDQYWIVFSRQLSSVERGFDLVEVS